MDKIEVELKPHPSNRPGHKIIYVTQISGRFERDTLAWGEVQMQSIGPRGSYYEFLDGLGHLIQEPSYFSNARGGQQYTPVKVYSDKAESRKMENYGKEIRPLKYRLIETIERLIQQGQLKEPRVLRAERDAENAAYARKARAQEEAKLAEFGAKADECIKPVVRLMGNTGVRIDTAALRASIIDAMKWAQSQ